LKHIHKRRGCRVVVDTSVVISGISAFRRPFVPGKSSSADLLYEWSRKSRFIWLVTPEILEEYKEVARRLNVRPNIAGRLINLLREEAEEVEGGQKIGISPDPATIVFVGALRRARPTFSLL